MTKAKGRGAFDMKKTVCLGALLLLCAYLQGCHSQSSGWQTFATDKGRFSISIPVTWLAHEDRGFWETGTKNAQGWDSFYCIYYVDHPALSVTAEKIFQQEEDLIQQKKPNPVNVEKNLFKYQGFPACEFSYIAIAPKGGASRSIVRIIAVNRRAYHLKFEKVLTDLTGNYTDLKAESYPNAEQFLNSLKFLKPDLNTGS
jgi:hypothetical protein